MNSNRREEGRRLSETDGHLKAVRSVPWAERD
jgi:hypothetical protein